MARRSILAGALLAALTASGCVVEVSFEPFGNDFSAEGDWLVNGGPPADNCPEGSEVRIVFYEGGSPYFFDELRFPCTAGGFRTDVMFEYGHYQIEWQLLDPTTGLILDRTGMRSFVMTSGPHADLTPSGPIDFVVGGFDPRGTHASLGADWTINGEAATAELCDAAGIETVQIWFHDEADETYASGVRIAEAPCADGEYDSVDRILADGRYLTEVRAVSSEGALVDAFRSTFVLDTSAVTHANLMTAAFEATVSTTLAIHLEWDTDSSAAGFTAGDCTTAGVATFTFALNDGSGVYDEAADIACGTRIDWTDIPPGDYSLYVEGALASGVKNWMVTCTGITVVDGRANAYTCQVDDGSGG